MQLKIERHKKGSTKKIYLENISEYFDRLDDYLFNDGNTFIEKLDKNGKSDGH